jgi:hypothetical protein
MQIRVVWSDVHLRKFLKMKTVIALKGNPNVGKTFSVRDVYERLLLEYTVLENQIFWDESIETAKRETYRQFKINDVLIGIYSANDPGEEKICISALDRFAQNGCQLIITTCRLSGNTIKIVEGMKHSGWNVNYLHKRNITDGVTELLYQKVIEHINE